MASNSSRSVPKGGQIVGATPTRHRMVFLQRLRFRHSLAARRGGPCKAISAAAFRYFFILSFACLKQVWADLRQNKSSRNILRLLLKFVLRRDRDSNSSDGYPSTRPPNGRIRPLCHLSPFACAKV
jgi:hypothetical protein